MSPTRSDVPSRVSEPSATLDDPQAAIPTSNTTVAAMAVARDRPVVNNANAIAALTNATSADSPYTPNTLASCATGTIVTWLLPSGTHGKPPMMNVPRQYSVATHAQGNNSNPRSPARRISRAVSQALTAGK